MADNSTCIEPFLKCCQETSNCFTDCTDGVEDMFSDSISGQLWRVEAMLLVNAILAGVMVGIGAYGHRYRHYGFTRYLLLGATTLFLPIISYVLSAFGSVGYEFDVTIPSQLIATCRAYFIHTYMVIVSICLVLISAINTSPIVATDDREDRSIHPPFELLVQGIWIVYLVISTKAIPNESKLNYLRLFAPFPLIYAKMTLKCYAFIKARKSFALGHNPRLIVGYMQQLQVENDQHASEEDVPPPAPLVVMGEDGHKLEKQPHGFMFGKNLEEVQQGGLVTIDRVWQLENLFLKDICLSFALFKLLRCRYARYKLTNVIPIETFKFVRNILLKDGEHERAFAMIADELSFLHDYYDSPLPVSYSDNWLVIVSMIISLLSVGYCIFVGTDIITAVHIAVRNPVEYIFFEP
ncbi:uncharacterized protein LOC119325860 [Triticum dicoccoides]|uniref:uncharacterized protein LOC119325860 n=1 Tax=Triticum dicoccoides TaxID=85692 RepID=UPI0018919856|nr:uncharacterized protein LOC119325860 [Triticum dicoccoides]